MAIRRSGLKILLLKFIAWSIVQSGMKPLRVRDIDQKMLASVAHFFQSVEDFEISAGVAFGE